MQSKSNWIKNHLWGQNGINIYWLSFSHKQKRHIAEIVFSHILTWTSRFSFHTTRQGNAHLGIKGIGGRAIFSNLSKAKYTWVVNDDVLRRGRARDNDRISIIFFFFVNPRKPAHTNQHRDNGYRSAETTVAVRMPFRNEKENKERNIERKNLHIYRIEGLSGFLVKITETHRIVTGIIRFIHFG